jgi:beta-lactamase class A
MKTRRATALRVISPGTCFLFGLGLLVSAQATQSGHPDGAVAAELRGRFERRLSDLTAGVDGVIGYAIQDLTSGDRIGHLDRETFPTASTIKLAIAYELFKQVDEGRIRLDQAVRLSREQAVGGSGVLVHLGTPTLSIRDYATLMIIVSDNTATNVLIDLLGMERVTGRMHGLGLSDTRLRRGMMDVAAARRGNENVSTPGEIVRLLEIIYKGGGLSEASGHELLGLLKKPKVSRLRAAIPAGIDVADKPGELEGVRVDAGIVYATNRPYIFCMMATFLKDERAGEQVIQNSSRAAYEYFSRLGGGSEYGRQIGR